MRFSPLNNAPEAPELVALCGDLTTATNINRALAQVFLLMAQGRISQKQAVAFGYLSQLLLQTVPGIRSEHVSAHGYQSWQNKLKISLMQNTDEPPEPSSGGENHDGPSVSVPVKSEMSNIESPAASYSPAAQTDTLPDYTSIFHRSLDLLDRKFDTTPEGRREAKALMTELEQLNPKPATVMKKASQTPPVPSIPNVPATLKSALPELPSVSAPPAPPEPVLCSPGRGSAGVPEVRQSSMPQDAEPALGASPSVPCHSAAAESGQAVDFVATACAESRRQGRGASRRASMPPEPHPPHPRQKRKAPTPATRTAHSTDWYAPLSWSGRQPDPFPSRQEKLKRKLRTMSDRRRQHQNQTRAFWR